jgi:ABC-type multidrug transport system fused ATPase/permease subunit
MGPRGSIVRGPDGVRWRVRRRWLDRSLPSLRQRWRRNKEEREPDSGSALDFLGIDLLDGTTIGIAIIAVVFLVVFVLMPLIGIALELIVLLVLFLSSLVARVVLRRPWVVEAVMAGDPQERVAFAVKGWRQSSQALRELRAAIPAGGPPERLTAGEPLVSPAPRRGA